MKLALVGSLVAASLLVGCNESGMSASTCCSLPFGGLQ